MKKQTYNGKPTGELKKLLSEKREILRAFRFNISGSRTTNVKEARNVRKEIARILTAMHGQQA